MAFTSLPAALLVGAASLVALIYFSERAVDKIIKLTKYFGFSATFVGLTVFSLATSLPEIFAHIAASLGILNGTLDYNVASSTVVGANIGSDIFQQTIILGFAILLMGRVAFSKHFTKTAYLPMIGAAALVLVLAVDGHLGRLDAAILLLAFIAYNTYLYFTDNHPDVDKKELQTIRPYEDTFLSFIYLAAMLASAHYLLATTEYLVKTVNIGGSLLGAVTLGIAAASPELFTAYNAARKKEVGASLGVLIGSNITNPVLALGIGAMMSTYAVPQAIITWDLPLKIISGLLLLTFFWVGTKKASDPKDTAGVLTRSAAIYLFLSYALYLYVRFAYLSIDVIR